jgi:hypothetical protein
VGALEVWALAVPDGRRFALTLGGRISGIGGAYAASPVRLVVSFARDTGGAIGGSDMRRSDSARSVWPTEGEIADEGSLLSGFAGSTGVCCGSGAER